MSKAFTRESDDDAPDPPLGARLAPVLPPGAKNYLTPAGARQLREELLALIEARRAQAESAATSGVASKPEPAAEQRALHLQESLESAVIVEPPAPPWTQVRFGATVTVRDQNGADVRYRIVGVDEADFDRGWISWLSPLARALLNARVGQRVRFKVPSGERGLEIGEVIYE